MKSCRPLSPQSHNVHGKKRSHPGKSRLTSVKREKKLLLLTQRGWGEGLGGKDKVVGRSLKQQVPAPPPKGRGDWGRGAHHPRTQISGICWLVGTRERRTRAFNPGRGGEGEVTLMKLVAYENGVMPFGSGVTSDFINLFFFFFLFFHGPCENGFNLAPWIRVSRSAFCPRRLSAR